jgi:hypothetical protein
MSTLFYTNPHSGKRLDDKDLERSYSDFARCLSEFTQPGVSLITTMPCGMGLDFHAEDDGCIWVEFYGDELQSAFVDLPTAKALLDRAWSAQPEQSVRHLFADLVQKWEY